MGVTWTIRIDDNELEGSLDKAGQAIYLNGPHPLILEFASWWRSKVDANQPLILYDEGYAIVVPLPPGATPADLAKMNSYYERLEHLRARLSAAGLDSWATELLSAERSASTSGEALSNTGVVLGRLIGSEDAHVREFQDEARSLDQEGQAIWNGHR